ncbi:Alpha/Beta hydrolase protein, partial [Zopfochytrium polystomum]
PVLMLHGLFQSAGVWVSNGPSSLAFYLVDQGFDVWLGNNRAVIPRHTHLTPRSAAYWNWSLDELAQHDVPTLLTHILAHTGRHRAAVVGHSQGNAQVFLALHRDPALSGHLSVLVALAPAVYVGGLVATAFPLRLLVGCAGARFRAVFGVHGFVPVMNAVQRWAPPRVFMGLAYRMFRYLFGWTDAHWQKSRKATYFQFTPRPLSTKIIHHWAQIATTKVIGPFQDRGLDANEQPCSFDLGCVQCPVALFYGSVDTIVDGERLRRELEAAEARRVGRHELRLVAAERIEGYEHLDCLWAVDAESKVWCRIAEVLEKTV